MVVMSKGAAGIRIPLGAEEGILSQRTPTGVRLRTGHADKRLEYLLHFEIGSDEGEMRQAVWSHNLEILANLHEIDNSHIVGATSHV